MRNALRSIITPNPPSIAGKVRNVLILATLPIWVFFIASLAYERTDRIEKADIELGNRVIQHSLTLSGWLSIVSENMTKVSQLTAVSSENCIKEVSGFVSTDFGVANLVDIDANGKSKCVYVGNRMIERSVPLQGEMKWLQEAANLRRMVIADSSLAPSTKRLVAVMYLPVIDELNAIKGFVQYTADLEKIKSAYLKEFNDRYSFSAVDQKGAVLFSVGSEGLFNDPAFAEKKQLKLPLVERVITYGRASDGTFHLYAEMEIPESPWRVIGAVEASSLFSVTDGLRGLAAAIFAALLMFTLLLVYRLRGDITRPIAEIAQSARQMVARKERLEIKLKRNAASEIIDLAENLNDMVASFQEAEQRASVKARDYENLLSSIVDAIISVDKNGKIAYANTAAIKLFGYDEDELKGMNVSALVSRAHALDHAKYVQHFFSEAISSRPMAQLRIVEGLAKSGGVLRLQVSLSKSLGSGGEQVSAVIRDVTASELMREQLHQTDKLMVIGQLAGGLIHDINNVLFVVRMATEEIAVQAPHNDVIQRYTGRILKSSKSIEDLIRRILVFSRKAELRITEVDLGAFFADEDYRGLLSQVAGKGISLSYDVEPGLPLLQVDQGLLESAIVNLVANARDAMQQSGSIRIRIFGDAAAGPGAVTGVVISIADTGCGIPEDYRERIFEPFFTTKSRGKGTGLGLAMVREFVEQSKGQIFVESSLNVGTTIIIKLPLH